MKSKLLLASMVMTFAFLGSASGQTQKLSGCIPADSKIYIAQMPGDFHKFMATAIKDADAKLLVVTERDVADFELKNDLEESKPEGWNPAVFVNHSASEDSVHMRIKNIKTGLIVFSASLDFGTMSDADSSRRVKRSFANNMARFLKDKVKKDAKAGCTL